MKLEIVDAGKGTQHYARPGAEKTLCGKHVQRVITGAVYSDRWDCQRCLALSGQRFIQGKAKDVDVRKGVKQCQACRAPLNGDDCLEVGGKVVCPDCADALHRGKAKDGLLSTVLKGAAILLALSYLSRIPEPSVEYDLTKYRPEPRSF